MKDDAQNDNKTMFYQLEKLPVHIIPSECMTYHNIECDRFIKKIEEINNFLSSYFKSEVYVNNRMVYCIKL